MRFLVDCYPAIISQAKRLMTLTYAELWAAGIEISPHADLQNCLSESNVKCKFPGSGFAGPKRKRVLEVPFLPIQFLLLKLYFRFNFYLHCFC
jgi:hypothetical protein